MNVRKIWDPLTGEVTTVVEPDLNEERWTTRTVREWAERYHRVHASRTVEAEAELEIVARELGGPDLTTDSYYHCPTCGPRVRVDEDGCCATCGADCTPVFRAPTWDAGPDVHEEE